MFKNIMKFVNTNNFNISVLEKEPFEHTIIDDFLNEEYIDDVLSELDKLTPDKSYYHGGDNVEKTKMAFNSNLGELIDNIFKELCSDEFIDMIEAKTGMTNIIRNNPNLHGAGVHKVFNSGFLTMHKDFNHTHDSDNGLIDRRLNLLLYMNPDWKEEYNGHLCLYDENKQQITKRVLPILNRCILFNTTDSIHGHPQPMCIPENKCRQSLALYYYSKNTTGLSVSGKKLMSVQWYSHII
jgi:hypothetical protein